jgi:enoyl-CoA hydratase
VGISINSKIRIACEKTKFAMPEALIGYFVDNGMSYHFSRICDSNLGLYMGMTGS